MGAHGQLTQGLNLPGLGTKHKRSKIVHPVTSIALTLVNFGTELSHFSAQSLIQSHSTLVSKGGAHLREGSRILQLEGIKMRSFDHFAMKTNSGMKTNFRKLRTYKHYENANASPQHGITSKIHALERICPPSSAVTCRVFKNLLHGHIQAVAH